MSAKFWGILTDPGGGCNVKAGHHFGRAVRVRVGGRFSKGGRHGAPHSPQSNLPIIQMEDTIYPFGSTGFPMAKTRTTARPSKVRSGHSVGVGYDSNLQAAELVRTGLPVKAMGTFQQSS